MLLNLLSSGYPFNITLGLLILHLFCVILALSMHEFAHGYAAYKMGDPTAKNEGRLSLNPLAHLDPVGFLMMLLLGFGWAKPVPVNPRNFSDPKKGMAVTSAAGPGMNLVLAFGSGLICSLLMQFDFYPTLTYGVNPLSVLSYTLYLFALLNVGLALFNLIPLPPLDGSNILLALLKPNAAAKYLQIRHYTRYIFLGLVVISMLADRISLFYYLDSIIWYPFDAFRYQLLEWIFSLGDLIFGWI